MDNDEESSDLGSHVQLSFYTNDVKLSGLPSTVFNVTLQADCSQINSLVNKSILLDNDQWTEKRFEFLIGDAFLRSSLKDFIAEYNIETESVINVECVLGLEAPKPLYDIQAPDWVSSVVIFKERIFCTTFSGDITVFSNGSKDVQSMPTHDGVLKCGALVKSPDEINKCKMIIGGENQLLTLYTIREEGTLEKEMVLRGHERSVECVSVNDANLAVSGSYDCTIKLWNLSGLPPLFDFISSLENDTASVFEKNLDEATTKKRKQSYVTKVPMLTIGGHKDAVTTVGWMPGKDGKLLSCSLDHSIIQWDVELAEEVSKIRGQKSFTNIDVHHSSGLIIASSSDALPRLYDVRSRDGSLVKQTFYGHERGWVTTVKWSPNNENCFVSSSTDTTTKVWDIRSGKTPLFDIHGHEDRVLCSCWSTEGLIATGSADSTVKVFQATN